MSAGCTSRSNSTTPFAPTAPYCANVTEKALKRPGFRRDLHKASKVSNAPLAEKEAVASEPSQKGSVPGQSLHSKSSYAAVDKAVRACQNLHEKLRSAEELGAAAALLDQFADALVAEKEERLEAFIGEALFAKNVRIDDLLYDWDPQSKGRITKPEFRLHVRKLFPKDKPPETVKVDHLFAELDDDDGGFLDTPELKAALKRMRVAAAGTRAKKAANLQRADGFRERAIKIRQGALAMTTASDQLQADLKKAHEGTAASQIGEILKAKNLKASDVVDMWDVSGDGEIDKDEFRAAVFVPWFGMPKHAKPAEVDQLFDEMNVGKAPALNTNVLKVALKQLKEDAENKKDLIREIGLSYIASLKPMKLAQLQYESELKPEKNEAPT